MTWCLVGMTLMPRLKPKHQAQYNDDTDNDSRDIFGDGNIKWLDFLAIDNLDDFTLIFTVLACYFIVSIAILVNNTLGKLGRREHMPAISTLDNNRKRDTHMMVERDFPAISIPEMFKDDFLGI